MKVIKKPWGEELWISSNKHYIIRILHLNKGERVSFHYHKKKIETLYIIKGKAKYILQKPGEDVQERIIKPGDVLEHEPFEIHREEALEDMEIIEISTPPIEDIVRVEDDYGR